MVLLDDLSLPRVFVWHILVKVILLHSVQVFFTFQHRIHLLWIAEEDVLILKVHLHQNFLHICCVKNPLNILKRTNIILYTLYSFSHVFELLNLLLHLLASYEGNFCNYSQNLSRQIILQVNHSLLQLFISDKPKARVANLLLIWIVFKVLNT